MLAELRHRRWDWAAFGAAWLLVAQLMLGGFMQGAAAAPAGNGAFFGIICSSSGDPPAALPDPSTHAKLPNCCVLGYAGTATLPPPAEETAPAHAAEAVAYGAATPTSGRGDRSDVRARGPPALRSA